MANKEKHCFAFTRRAIGACALVAVAASGTLSLTASSAQETLVLTQTPREAQASAPKSLADSWYPAGTRVVASSKAPFAGNDVAILSQGLNAAGSPVVSYDGRRVVFAGKKTADADWQIYETAVSGGHPRALTDFPGGATHPALLGDGSVVFAARPGMPGGASPVSQLFVQSPGSKASQLTFAPAGASDPAMMSDGRILFVSAQPGENKLGAGTALYTINKDGTELTAFACQHDSPSLICRPRQLNDGRVAFLSTDDIQAASFSQNDAGRKCGPYTAETVRMARPFASRAKLLQRPDEPAAVNVTRVEIRSVQPCGSSNLLICAAAPGTDGRFCCYRVGTESQSLGTPLIAHLAYEIIEAVAAAPSLPPMGRLSTMDATKKRGQILCLNINDTIPATADEPAPKAVRVRLLAGTVAGAPRVLGELDVQADGSFMAEVPADLPLGFETLDEHGKVVRREAPNMWVRSGENRACVGCHAAHNRSPHNHRPLAVRVPVANFCNVPQTNVLTQVRK